MKHGERRRSGHKTLSQDLENLPDGAGLVYNLEQDDYVKILCGSLDDLPSAFARLDREDRERNLRKLTHVVDVNVIEMLQISTSALSTADRRIIRTKAMDKMMIAAGGKKCRL